MFVPLFRSDFSFSRYALFKSFYTGAASIFFGSLFFQVRRRNKLVPLRHPEVVGDGGAGDGDGDGSGGGDGGSNGGSDDSGSSIST